MNRNGREAERGFRGEGGLKTCCPENHIKHERRKEKWTNTTSPAVARAKCGETLQISPSQEGGERKGETERKRGRRGRKKSKSKADGLHRGRTRETLRAVVKSQLCFQLGHTFQRQRELGDKTALTGRCTIALATTIEDWTHYHVEECEFSGGSVLKTHMFHKHSDIRNLRIFEACVLLQVLDLKRCAWEKKKKKELSRSRQHPLRRLSVSG